VVVLAVLVCLDQDGTLGVLLLDEEGASLDEPRLVAIGRAFRTLSDRRGLLTIMTLPSKSLSESAAEFARMQIGFVRPQPQEPLSPPPHIVCAPSSRLKAAA
jgi:hypothetical protein